MLDVGHVLLIWIHLLSLGDVFSSRVFDRFLNDFYIFRLHILVVVSIFRYLLTGMVIGSFVLNEIRCLFRLCRWQFEASGRNINKIETNLIIKLSDPNVHFSRLFIVEMVSQN